MTLKLCGSVSVAIPVELRQPRANSLAVGCDGSSLGEGLSCRVNSARLIQPKGFVAELSATRSSDTIKQFTASKCVVRDANDCGRQLDDSELTA